MWFKLVTIRIILNINNDYDCNDFPINVTFLNMIVITITLKSTILHLLVQLLDHCGNESNTTFILVYGPNNNVSARR